MPLSLKILNLVHHFSWQPERNQVVIEQNLELECDCGTTIIIEQHIDGMTMIEGVRYPVSAGVSTLPLKQMRIINPRIRRADGQPASYELAVRVYAAGIDPVMSSETVSFLNLIKELS